MGPTNIIIWNPCPVGVRECLIVLRYVLGVYVCVCVYIYIYMYVYVFGKPPYSKYLLKGHSTVPAILCVAC